MDIIFKGNKLKKTFNEEATLRKEYGQRANFIMARLAVLQAAANLALVPRTPPERRHQLTGERGGQFAVEVGRQSRLVFEPNHDPVPLMKDGGIDTGRITSIKILEVVDYH